MYDFVCLCARLDVMVTSALAHVLPSGDARTELPKALRRFRHDGALADPVVFGAHRKAEAVVIPYTLYEKLLPAIEDLEIAEQVRQRVAEGDAVPLSDVAASIGLNPDDYR